MKKIITLSVLFILAVLSACKDQLDIVNPNQPAPESAKTEQGVIALAQGALYVNGNMGDFFGYVLRVHELMGDMIGSLEAGGAAYCPDNIILDDGSNLISIYPKGQKDYLRVTNIPSNKYNTFYSEWADMYSLNNAMNAVLVNIDPISMSNSKKNTLKTWANFWKGFAYSRIGSLYYAGLINNEPLATNNKYVTKDSILVEAEVNFTKADSLLQSLSGTDYTDVLGKLISNICQVGKGGVLSPDEWRRHINTMRARNLLVNKPVASMTSADWDKVLSLTSNGIRSSDNTFTVRTDDLGNLLSTYGYIAALAIGPDANGGGFSAKVSERLIQEFRPGDNRLANNFKQIPTWIGRGDRSTSFNTRYVLVNHGNGMVGVEVLVNRGDTGIDELYIAGTYEENVLMLAEANIYLGNIDAGLAKIDELRNYQGAGLAALSGTGLTSDQAKEELRSERRVGLAFLGLSFYDARRWGVLKNGRTRCVVVDFSGYVNKNATIQYGYLDYWDVPIFESFYNPPSSDSADIKNPN